MKQTLIPEAVAVSKSHRHKTAWQNFVRTMAMVVIFCTTYALILPAITMQPDLICTLAEHPHSERPYPTYADKHIPSINSDS